VRPKATTTDPDGVDDPGSGGVDDDSRLGGATAIGRRKFLRGLATGAAWVVAGPSMGVLAAGCDSGRPPESHKPGTTSETSAPVTVPPPLSIAGAALRPPAVPLAVRDPYVSAWLCATELAGTWATGWDGSPMSVCGLARIDGRTYVWCGDPQLAGGGAGRMTQTSLEVTPTRSIFTVEGGGVRLVVEWLSPVEPGDRRLQSVPLALITVTASATDEMTHKVEVCCDVTGEWASWIDTDKITWATSETTARHWAVQLAREVPFTERNEMAAWGSATFSTLPGLGTTYQAGESATVRAAFASAGKLDNTADTRFRAVNDATPVFALASDLGEVANNAALVHWSVGHFEAPAIEYMGQPLDPLWKAYWPTWEAVVDDFLAGASAARSRAASFDAQLTAAAQQAGGSGYAALCALALRQAYGACQLVIGPNGEPWAFLKEISSDDDVSTVDIIFDSCPVWLRLDPGYLTMLLDPLLSYAASGQWEEGYAPHSLGFWPLANRNPAGASSEPMPVEDSGALLVMAAAYASRVSADTGRSFLAGYEALWTRWADLLVTQLPSPPTQLTTIDFLGESAGNSNLAILGIIGLGAAAQIAGRVGDDATARIRAAQAKTFASQWAGLAMDRSGRHLDADIGSAGTWSDLDNAFWDRSLGTGLVLASVAATQAAWYRSHLDEFGLGVESTTPTLARLDIQFRTAAWLYDYPVGPEMVGILARYVGHTNYLAPLPDTYDPQTGDRGKFYNWRARPVVGGIFALLLVK
jgi:hypothetical protein